MKFKYLVRVGGLLLVFGFGLIGASNNAFAHLPGIICQGGYAIHNATCSIDVGKNSCAEVTGVQQVKDVATGANSLLVDIGNHLHASVSQAVDDQFNDCLAALGERFPSDECTIFPNHDQSGGSSQGAGGIFQHASTPPGETEEGSVDWSVALASTADIDEAEGEDIRASLLDAIIANRKIVEPAVRADRGADFCAKASAHASQSFTVYCECP